MCFGLVIQWAGILAFGENCSEICRVRICCQRQKNVTQGLYRWYKCYGVIYWASWRGSVKPVNCIHTEFVWQVVVAVKRPLTTLVEHIHNVLSKLAGVSCIAADSDPAQLYVYTVRFTVTTTMPLLLLLLYNSASYPQQDGKWVVAYRLP